MSDKVPQELKPNPGRTRLSPFPEEDEEEQGMNCNENPTAAPPAPPPPADPLQKIESITSEVIQLLVEVHKFPSSSGTSRTSKPFIVLEEKFTQKLITLDSIESGGREDVRRARKECIQLIQEGLDGLEAKLGSSSSSQRWSSASACAMI